ncbi:ester cyclase [Acidovorax sp. LjRoot66]|uniref:ester cyclase n=1 Tax=Acidovorax sp. LjRoot66 TaxID=3342334 RepID=UPI003ED00BE8
MTTLTQRHAHRGFYAIAAAALVAASLTTAFGATPDPGAANPKPIVPVRSVASSAASHQALATQWLAFWNGDLDLAKTIVAPDFALHATLLDGRPDTEISGPAGLAGWVAQSHGLFGDLRFTVQVGPIIDGDFAVLRWVAVGRYRGGIPGAYAPVGTPLRFTGTDILRIEGGKVKDYWLNADTGDLLMQLKVGQGPATQAAPAR